MSLVLVSNRKSIQPQKVHQFPPHECTSPPILFLHCHSFSHLRRTWWYCVTQHLWRGRVKGNRLIQCSSGRMAVNASCVCVCKLHYYMLTSQWYWTASGTCKPFSWPRFPVHCQQETTEWHEPEQQYNCYNATGFLGKFLTTMCNVVLYNII